MFKWLTGQLPPSDEMQQNTAFQVICGMMSCCNGCISNCRWFHTCEGHACSWLFFSALLLMILHACACRLSGSTSSASSMKRATLLRKLSVGSPGSEDGMTGKKEMLVRFRLLTLKQTGSAGGIPILFGLHWVCFALCFESERMYSYCRVPIIEKFPETSILIMFSCSFSCLKWTLAMAFNPAEKSCKAQYGALHQHCGCAVAVRNWTPQNLQATVPSSF